MSIVKSSRVSRRPDPIGSLLSFKDLQGEAAGGMCSDVAVHQPHAGVVRLEGNNSVPGFPDQHHVAAWKGVGEIGFEIRRVEIGVVVLLHDGEIMSMKMNLMTS